MEGGKNTKVPFRLPWLKDLEYYPHGITSHSEHKLSEKAMMPNPQTPNTPQLICSWREQGRPGVGRQRAERQLPSGCRACPSSNAYLGYPSPKSSSAGTKGRGTALATQGFTESLVEVASLALIKGLKERAAMPQPSRAHACLPAPSPHSHPQRRDTPAGETRPRGNAGASRPRSEQTAPAPSLRLPFPGGPSPLPPSLCPTPRGAPRPPMALRRAVPGQGIAAGRPRRRPPGAEALAAGAALHGGRSPRPSAPRPAPGGAAGGHAGPAGGHAGPAWRAGGGLRRGAKGAEPPPGRPSGGRGAGSWGCGVSRRLLFLSSWEPREGGSPRVPSLVVVPKSKEMVSLKHPSWSQLTCARLSSWVVYPQLKQLCSSHF